MDFARKILQNYGWKDGDGLGKNRNGIAKPLKATLKFDNAGFGADQAADDFNNHWWERVFNEAATNVDIIQQGEQIKLNLRDEENSVEISTKGYSVKKLEKFKRNRGEMSGNKSNYENFLQASTLTNLGGEIENPDKIDANFIEVSKVNVLTDEELFKACGGRTAHKGARHGLKLSGKLSRIEQQEAELLSKMRAKYNLETKLPKSEMIEKKCTKQKTNKSNALEEAHQVCNIVHVEDNVLKTKKRKLRVAVTVETEETNQQFSVTKSKKKKLSRGETKTSESNHMQTSNIGSIAMKDNDDKMHFTKTKKKKKKLSDNIEQNSISKKKNKYKDEK